jgi:hypothetical protein
MTEAVFKKRSLNESDIATLRAGNVWEGKGPVGPDRLNLLTLTHVDFEGNTQQGEMMVMDVAADAAIEIFQTLYERKFPIQKIALMSDFGGDDNLAMSANASNAFISRKIAGSSSISVHAYGLAIDVNQIQNPFLVFDGEPGQKMILHPKESSMGYLNRNPNRPDKPPRFGMVEPIVSVFRENGFTVWGGDWNDPLDYHHFQVPRSLAELVAAADYPTAQKIFNAHVAHYRKNKSDFLGTLKEAGVDIKNVAAVVAKI